MSGVVSVSGACYVVLASSVGSMSRLVISLLGLALFVTSCGEKYVFEMSRNYVPPYNPGGDLFGEDEDFAQSYEVYKQRREDILADAGSGTRELRTGGRGTSDSRSGIQKRDVVEKLREYGAVPLDRVESGSKGMVNREGIDLTRVEGARFLDVDLKLGNEVPEELEARAPASGGRKRVSTQSERAALPGAKSAAQGDGASNSPAAGVSSGGKVSVSNVSPPAATGPGAKGGVGAAPAVSNKEGEKSGAPLANNKSISTGKKAAAKHLQETKNKKKPSSDVADSAKKRGGGDKKALKEESAKKSGGGSIKAAPVADGRAVPSADKKKPSVAPLVEPTSKSKDVASITEKSGGAVAKKSANSMESGGVAPVKGASIKTLDLGKIKRFDAVQPAEQAGGDVHGKSEEKNSVPRAAPLTKDDRGSSDREERTRTVGGEKKGVVGRDFLDSWKFDDDEYEDDYIIQYMD